MDKAKKKQFPVYTLTVNENFWKILTLEGDFPKPLVNQKHLFAVDKRPNHTVKAACVKNTHICMDVRPQLLRV